MLPFCGYNMADYFEHWLALGKKNENKNLPKIFYVNWFRKNSKGDWLWPGFGENSRVLKWIFERCSGEAKAQKTAIGFLPTENSLDINGLDLQHDALKDLLTVDNEAWKCEVQELREYYKIFGKNLPKGIQNELNSLENRLNNK